MIFTLRFSTTPDIVCIYENGKQLMKTFNFSQSWSQPIKVLKKRGLQLRMPDEPSFDLIDVLKLLGFFFINS